MSGSCLLMLNVELRDQLSELKKCSIFSANYKIELRRNSIFRKRSKQLLIAKNRLNQLCFDHLIIKKFEFVSNFDIRISNFSIFGTPKVELRGFRKITSNVEH